MEEQLSRIGWHAHFFPATRPPDAANFPSVGARGCFLSHLSVLRNARNVGAEQLVILEDDVDFVYGFPEQWKFSMAALQDQKWSIFYPGHILDSLPAGLSIISPSVAVRCAHFMVVNGAAISSLVNGLEKILSRPAGHPLGGPMHVDGAYSTIRAQDHTLVTYAHFPVLGYQRSSRTDIGNLKWYDRVGVLTPVLNVVRKLNQSSRNF